MLKHVRKSLLPIFSSVVLPSQWGSGLNGGETAICHLYLRNLVDIAFRDRVCLSCLFVDIVTAFAALMRLLVFPAVDGDL